LAGLVGFISDSPTNCSLPAHRVCTLNTHLFTQTAINEHF